MHGKAIIALSAPAYLKPVSKLKSVSERDFPILLSNWQSLICRNSPDRERGGEVRSAMIRQIYDGLGEQLGRSSVRMVEDAEAVAYCTPGLGHPLLVFLHETEPAALVRVEVPVVRRADWGMGELSSVLLAEQERWAFGRVERRGEGIVIEHCLLADTVPHKLAALINCLADTAIRLRADLGRMGALTLFEEPPSEEGKDA